MQSAADLIDRAFSDNITLNIRYGWGSYDNVIDPSLSGSDGAYAQALQGDSVSYATVKSWLTADATSSDDTTAVASLPTGSSAFPGGNNLFFVTSAQEKALGHFAGSSSAIDGAVAFGTATTSQFWVGIALHELTHAIGRLSLHYESDPVILDMYRYDRPGHFQWTEGASSASPSYLSIDGGRTDLADFGRTSDYSDFLNTGVQGANDAFNEFYQAGTLQTLSAVDTETMDIIGFNRADIASPVVSFATPNFTLASFGTRAAAGSWTSQDQSPRELADVNGDGKDDIVGFGADGIYIALATGDGKFGAPDFTLASFGTRAAAGGWTGQDQYPRLLGDVDGDGKADIVGFGANGVYVSLATGDGKFADPVRTLDFFGTSAAAGSWTSQSGSPRELADVNGDGKDDIVGFGADGVYVALATGGGKFATPKFTLPYFGTRAAAGSWTSQDQSPRELADVNGDGNADIVGFGADGVYVALANGDGTFAAQNFTLPYFGTRAAAGSWTSQNDSPRELADVNGDGKADIVGFGADGVYVATATGAGKFADQDFTLASFGTRAAAGSWTSQNQSPRELADVNGDGKADIVGFGADGAYVALANGASSTSASSTAFSFADLTAAVPTASTTSSTSFPSGGASSETSATAATVAEMQLANQTHDPTHHYS
ncbi:MAG: NF038122 family metalloprotease [Thiohalocapsa sp.]